MPVRRDETQAEGHHQDKLDIVMVDPGGIEFRHDEEGCQRSHSNGYCTWPATSQVLHDPDSKGRIEHEP